ncbi:galactokinase [Nakamurella sp. A5-74]|uniref:Galactokinase n=1 Tax=Nakamurella sp. A5-74 TaxID=3158264 RepID=A0AAU8DPD6_9ACTN
MSSRSIPATHAEALYHTTYGGLPDGVWSSPGRVNLIGEHTDYTGGLVLPFAIDDRAVVAAGRIDEPVVRIVSSQRPGGIIEIPIRQLRPGSAAATGWPAYPAGAVWAVGDAGAPVSGLQLALDSAVPVGAGLSSSAAVECAVALAAAELAGSEMFDGPTGLQQLARVAQRAENEFVGVPCGLMDQMASAAGQAGNLLFFDVGAGTIEQVPFDPTAVGLTLLVIDTRAHHSLADGEYARRRASCERATAVLGLTSLREIDDLDAALAVLAVEQDGAVLTKRVRHVVTENARVEAVVAFLRDGEMSSIAADLTASHRSLQHDFEVSSIELDLAVDAALDAGALGARMTGGGFGGSAIALVDTADAAEITRAVEHAFLDAALDAPVSRSYSPSAGARRDT